MNKMITNLLSAAAVILFLSSCQQGGKSADPADSQPDIGKTAIERIEQHEHISQASKAGNLVVLSGQIGDGPTMTEQAQSVFNTIDKLLAKAGTDKSKIIFANVYLTNMNDYEEFNNAWKKWLADSNSKPSRATVQVVQLAKPEWKVEVQVFASL